jgi:PIN domain nuclease of toxin-antitoxin system
MGSVVLDTSAVIALIKNEDGVEAARTAVRGALVSIVNHAEILSRLVRGGMSLDAARMACRRAAYVAAPFTKEEAEECARLVRWTHHLGLSLADRACLALAKLGGHEVLTADRAWTKLQIGVAIRAIR